MTNIQEQAKNSLAKQNTRTTLQVVKGLTNTVEVKQRFQEILGQKSASFLASLTSIVASNTNFEGIDPNSIVSAALIAATLDLPINPNFGFAHIIPYRGKTMKAQFQMGYKAFIQLAIRTGMYKTINATHVFEGELIASDRFRGTHTFDQNQKKSDKIVGYYSFFELSTGFQKDLYMTTEELQCHGKKYSKNFADINGQWKSNFNGMSLKTVLKSLLSKYGILSTELKMALQSDQAIVHEDPDIKDFKFEYVDNPETDDVEILEVKKEPKIKLDTAPEDRRLDKYGYEALDLNKLTNPNWYLKAIAVEEGQQLDDFMDEYKTEISMFDDKDQSLIEAAYVKRKAKK